MNSGYAASKKELQYIRLLHHRYRLIISIERIIPLVYVNYDFKVWLSNNEGGAGGELDDGN